MLRLCYTLSLCGNGWTTSLLAKRAGIAAPGDKTCGNKGFVRGPVWVLRAGTNLSPACGDQSGSCVRGPVWVLRAGTSLGPACGDQSGSCVRGPIWVLCAGTSLGPVCGVQSKHSLGPDACRRADQARSRHTDKQWLLLCARVAFYGMDLPPHPAP